jgi:hypothetical protein
VQRLGCLSPNSEVRGALGGARLGCTRRWGSQWLYQIDTAPDLPAACAANDGGECGASNFGVWVKVFRSAAVASSTMPPKDRKALSGQCSRLSGASNFGVRIETQTPPIQGPPEAQSPPKSSLSVASNVGFQDAPNHHSPSPPGARTSVRSTPPAHTLFSPSAPQGTTASSRPPSSHFSASNSPSSPPVLVLPLPLLNRAAHPPRPPPCSRDQ